MIVGLTGGIATGKSTVSKYFKGKNIPVIDADIISREISEKSGILELLIKHFGISIIKNKKLDRKALAKIIFNNPEKREELNSIMHPAIIEQIKLEIDRLKSEKLIILDVPLLFETGLDKLTDKVIVVYLEKDIQINRLMKRDDISKESAEKRINSQMKLKRKLELADIIIDNNSTLNNLYTNIEKIYDELYR